MFRIIVSILIAIFLGVRSLDLIFEMAEDKNGRDSNFFKFSKTGMALSDKKDRNQGES